MVMYAKDRISIRFNQRSSKELKEVSLIGYVSKEEALKNIDNVNYINENSELSLIFQSDEVNAKLYADFLIYYDIEGVNVTNDEMYFTPRDSEYRIINYSNGNNISLVPGEYLLYYESDNSNYYYAIRISNNENTMQRSIWEQMKKDISKYSELLTIQYLRGNNHLSLGDKIIDGYFMSKILFLIEEYPKLLSLLSKIEKNSNFNVKKDYMWQTINKNKKSDNVTNAMNQKKYKYNREYSYKNIIHYDTEANKNLKYILMYILNFCTQATKTLEDLISEENAEYQLNRNFVSTRTNRDKRFEEQYKLLRYCVQKIQKIQNLISNLVFNSWLKYVSNINTLKVSNNYVQKKDYRVLYLIFHKLIKDKEEISLDSEYGFQLRPSSELYEIWCYLYLIRSLIELGFEVYDGWIFSENIKTNIPYLKSGDYVLLKNKQGLHIKLVFDEVLTPKNARESQKAGIPFYTVKNNRPDIRLDFFKDFISDGNFLKTIIFDAKYRAGSSIFYSKRGFDDSKVFEQLNNYHSMLHHVNCGKDTVVSYAVALYPGKEYTNKEIRDSWKNHGVDAIRLSPVLENENTNINLEFRTFLNEAIEESVGSNMFSKEKQ